MSNTTYTRVGADVATPQEVLEAFEILKSQLISWNWIQPNQIYIDDDKAGGKIVMCTRFPYDELGSLCNIDLIYRYDTGIFELGNQFNLCEYYEPDQLWTVYDEFEILVDQLGDAYFDNDEE